MKRIAVFCGSSTGARSVYAEAARQFGTAMATHGLGLVFGAGHIGLMGVLADAVLAAGGEAIGVIPRAMVEKELAHRGLTKLHVVSTMHERKALMADLADGFVALPGGYGTLDELFEILTWAQLGYHAKPIALLNTEGYFDPLLAWIQQAVSERFMKAKHLQLLKVAKEPELLLELLLHHRPEAQTPKWIADSDR